jgi:hypothetical protein
VWVVNTEIQRIIRDYYEQLYTNIFDRLEEMDKFLGIYTLSKLNHEEMENRNRSTSKKIASIIFF